MKSFFKVLIAFLCVVAVGATGTAVYFAMKCDKCNVQCEDNDLTDDALKVVLSESEMKQKAKELMELYMNPVIGTFEGEYHDDIKTLLLIKLSDDSAKSVDCEARYKGVAEYYEGIGYEVEKPERYSKYNELLGYMCTSQSKYYDAKVLKEKSLELFGKDILSKNDIADGYGSSYDYIEKEDAYIFLTGDGTGPRGHEYAITSSSFLNNQFKINFIFHDSEANHDSEDDYKQYEIVFDVNLDGKYVFNNLKEIEDFKFVY